MRNAICSYVVNIGVLARAPLTRLKRKPLKALLELVSRDHLYAVA